MMDRLTIIATVREYLARGDINGLSRWLDEVEPIIKHGIEESRQRRTKALTRSLQPTERRGDIVCFDEKDLHWALSRTTTKRLGLD